MNTDKTIKAIILAAGMGKRLGKEGHNQPKCLLRFNGKSLLERHINILRSFNIDEVIIVIGYQSEMIQEEINRLEANQFIRTVYNPNYTQGSLISLETAKEYLICGDKLLLMDADVLYDKYLIERLVNTNRENCFLLDRDFIPGDEPVKLYVKDGYLVEFRKQVAADLTYDFWGESVGFFRFSSSMASRLATRTENYVKQGLYETPYEEVIRDLLLENPQEFSYEDITGYAWIEIDFPEDIQHAQNKILPQIDG